MIFCTKKKLNKYFSDRLEKLISAKREYDDWMMTNQNICVSSCVSSNDLLLDWLLAKYGYKIERIFKDSKKCEHKNQGRVTEVKSHICLDCGKSLKK